MIKSLYTFILALMIVPMFASEAASLEPIDLIANPAHKQELKGVWEGSWSADVADSDSFRLTIWNVNASGHITGSRMYETQDFGSYDVPTEGDINFVDGQLHLDDGKGQDEWIKLRLYRDSETGQLWLKGRYSTVGDGTVFLGDIDVKKISSLAAVEISKEEFSKILATDIKFAGEWSSRFSSKSGTVDLSLSPDLSSGTIWWDSYPKDALNIRIGSGTLSIDISGQNRTYYFRYVPDGERYKLDGVLTGLTRDGSGMFMMDVVLKPKKCLLCDLKLQNPDSTAGLNINATAKKLIEEWGENAATEASVKAINSEEVGDLESRATWLKVRARVEELSKR